MNATALSSHRSSTLRDGLIAFTAGLLLSAAGVVSAAPHGGGGFHGGFSRGGFAGGGIARGGFSRGGFAGGGIARGGFSRGGFARGGYPRGGVARGGFGRGYGRPYGGHDGDHDGDHDRRRGWGWAGYGWPYWGLGAGLGLGLYLSTLPWDYSTYWWDGVPYYYAGDNYYTWDGAAGDYQQVQPPLQVTQQAANAPPPRLYAYPKNGQSAQQQAGDEAACREWASHQTNGGDAASAGASGAPGGPAPAASGDLPPSSSSAVGAIAAATGSPPSVNLGAAAGPNSEFLRAEAACLQGRGYSVD